MIVFAFPCRDGRGSPPIVWEKQLFLTRARENKEWLTEGKLSCPHFFNRKSEKVPLLFFSNGDALIRNF